MPNPPIVLTQEGKMLSNERVDVWIDSVGGSDANDGFSQAGAKATVPNFVDLIDGAKFGRECRKLVMNGRGTLTLTKLFEAIDIDSGQLEVGNDKPLIVFDGGTGLDEVLASTATTGSAGGLNEIIAAANDAATQWNLHLSRGIGAGHPGGPDAANVITGTATDFDSTRALLLEIKTKQALHIADLTYHGAADVVNVITADNCFDLKSMTELALDIQAQNDGHVTTGGPVHDLVGGDTTTAPAPTKATAIAGTSLTVAAAGWGINAYRGYGCEFLSGPLSGETYVIRRNDGDTLYFNGEWPLDPGTGSNFRIVRPETVIDGTGPTSFFTFSINVRGIAEVLFQNFRTTNGAILQAGTSGANFAVRPTFSHVVMECQPFQIFPMNITSSNAVINFDSYLRDCSLPDCDLVATPSRWGVTQNADVLFGTLVAREVPLYIRDSVLQTIALGGTKGRMEALDSSFGYCELKTSNAGSPNHPGFLRCRFGEFAFNPVGGAPIPVFPGLRTEGVYGYVVGGIITAGATHGIEAMKGSHLVIFGGMGTATATGCYCHDGSSVDQYRGYGNTGVSEFTGAGGTVELSEDGSTQKSTWAGVDTLPVSTPECTSKKWFGDAEPDFTTL